MVSEISRNRSLTLQHRFLGLAVALNFRFQKLVFSESVHRDSRCLCIKKDPLLHMQMACGDIYIGSENGDFTQWFDKKDRVMKSDPFFSIYPEGFSG